MCDIQLIKKTLNEFQQLCWRHISSLAKFGLYFTATTVEIIKNIWMHGIHFRNSWGECHCHRFASSERCFPSCMTQNVGAASADTKLISCRLSTSTARTMGSKTATISPTVWNSASVNWNSSDSLTSIMAFWMELQSIKNRLSLVLRLFQHVGTFIDKVNSLSCSCFT